jgi:3-oxoacyl-[acyl-carrier-protein] synthase-1
MRGRPLSIIASGMVTAVGLSARASCAAIRCGINNFQETRFSDSAGEWISGSEVPMERSWRGTTKLAKMLAMAVEECATEVGAGAGLEDMPVLIGVAEDQRPGRPDRLVREVFFKTQAELGLRFHPASEVLAYGRAAGVVGLAKAAKLIFEDGVRRVMVAGVDSLLSASMLEAYEERERLLTSVNSDGFVPGEGAAAVMLETPSQEPGMQLLCCGVGTAIEKAHVESGIPNRADGLVSAIRTALKDAGCTIDSLDFRITDVSGEQYAFREATLALTRLLRKRKQEFDIWHPADCVGEVGACCGPIILGVLHASMNGGYSPGSRALCHLGNDTGERVALVVAREVS